MTDATAAKVEKSCRTLLRVISTLSFRGTTETLLLPHPGERRTETVEEPDPVCSFRGFRTPALYRVDR